MLCFLFFKQKTAYEMRISDWSSDVCSSDLARRHPPPHRPLGFVALAAQRMTRRRIVETGAGGLDRQHERAIRTGAFHRRRLAVRRKPDREARPVLAGIDGRALAQIGRASCMERVCPVVLISGVAGVIKKTTEQDPKAI